jgi:hypothetical protein
MKLYQKKKEREIRIKISEQEAEQQVKQQIEIAKIEIIIKKLDILFEKSSKIYDDLNKKYENRPDFNMYSNGDPASLQVAFEKAIKKIQKNKKQIKKLIQEINNFLNLFANNKQVKHIFEENDAKVGKITNMIYVLENKYKEISKEVENYNKRDNSKYIYNTIDEI